VRGEVAYEDGEQLVEHVLVEACQGCLFQDQLPVDDEREQLPDGEEQVEVPALLLVRRGGAYELAEGVGLFTESAHVGKVGVRVEGRPPVMGADRAPGGGPALAGEEL